jgi:hypothetical protein
MLNLPNFQEVSHTLHHALHPPSRIPSQDNIQLEVLLRNKQVSISPQLGHYGLPLSLDIYRTVDWVPQSPHVQDTFHSLSHNLEESPQPPWNILPVNCISYLPWSVTRISWSPQCLQRPLFLCYQEVQAWNGFPVQEHWSFIPQGHHHKSEGHISPGGRGF